MNKTIVDTKLDHIGITQIRYRRIIKNILSPLHITDLEFRFAEDIYNCYPLYIRIKTIHNKLIEMVICPNGDFMTVELGDFYYKLPF